MKVKKGITLLATAFFIACCLPAVSSGGGEDRWRPRADRVVTQERLKEFCTKYVINGRWINGRCVVELDAEWVCKNRGGKPLGSAGGHLICDCCPDW